MKKSDKIKLIVAFILIITVVLGMVNSAKAQSTSNAAFIESKQIFTTTYKIEVNGKNYYTNSLLIVEKNLEFKEYKRNGKIKGSYSFPLDKVKIFVSLNR